MHLEHPHTQDPTIEKARELILSCVHCGFCNATCPTYQITGDELDGPRGRIYLIKSLIESGADGSTTQFHLDRCLTCRNCESTCPSGVRYGELVHVGRTYAEQKTNRSAIERFKRQAIVWLLSSKQPLGALVKIAHRMRFILPRSAGAQLPQPLRVSSLPISPPNSLPVDAHERWIILDGCAQRHLSPQINQAAEYVLAQFGVTIQTIPQVDCCGALHAHTTGEHDGVTAAKKAIDGFISALDAGANGIVMTASGCGVHVRDYPTLFAKDDPYHAKAQRVSAHTRDISELIHDKVAENPNVLRLTNAAKAIKIAVHQPCTLQHGQKLGGSLPELINTLGATTIDFAENHLCCGSAGSYSLLQRDLSKQLKARKVSHLNAANADLIVSANIGCILHLVADCKAPVRHWIEWLAESVDTSHTT